MCYEMLMYDSLYQNSFHDKCKKMSDIEGIQSVPGSSRNFQSPTLPPLDETLLTNDVGTQVKASCSDDKLILSEVHN